MTLTSENITAIEAASPNVLPIKRRGRPTGVKNGDGVAHKKKTVKKPRVRINTDAIVANGEVKNLKAQVARLNIELEEARNSYESALHALSDLELHVKDLNSINKYLEGKVFK
jgi:hypothetical protein